MDKHLHIICLDIPYPVDYGGVFDLFYKIKALHEKGIKIHLHCFEYGRSRQAELSRYCIDVQYYKRKTGIKGFSATLPYIISSRKSTALLQNLSKNDYPILIEGIHCSHLLTDERFKSRKIILRLHNVEYLYYRELYRTTNSVFKKLYYFFESKLLFRYEKKISQKVLIASVSEQDLLIYRKQFYTDRIFYLPVFLPYKKVLALEGIGDYCLYHGNLSVPENEKAATWLLKNVFKDLGTAFVIAGKNPSVSLEKRVSQQANTCLVINPTESEMQDLIEKAQINVLPSFNKTGIKLKVMNALFNGRHCVVNEAATLGTSLTGACHTGSNAEALKSIITQLYHLPFGEEDMKLRKFLLEGNYDNSKNAQQLIQWIW
ncbi:MAG: glycosyltransferase [Chitinophagaceae bacterium]|nr:glycosyltransferase [Chitinophagaceae bacterium]